MKVGPLKTVTQHTLADIHALVRQLRRKGDVMRGTKAELSAIVKNKYSVLMVIEDKKRIVGMGSLYIHQKLGKRAGYIEDMVVDDAYRGQGLGTKLLVALISTARKMGVSRLDLTSGSDRVSANALYKKMGFKARDTNVYVLPLELCRTSQNNISSMEAVRSSSSW